MYPSASLQRTPAAWGTLHRQSAARGSYRCRCTLLSDFRLRRNKRDGETHDGDLLDGVPGHGGGRAIAARLLRHLETKHGEESNEEFLAQELCQQDRVPGCEFESDNHYGRRSRRTHV